MYKRLKTNLIDNKLTIKITVSKQNLKKFTIPQQLSIRVELFRDILFAPF
jgi:hypothetical protein